MSNLLFNELIFQLGAGPFGSTSNSLTEWVASAGDRNGLINSRANYPGLVGYSCVYSALSVRQERPLLTRISCSWACSIVSFTVRETLPDDNLILNALVKLRSVVYC